jgi:hypothetical protein
MGFFSGKFQDETASDRDERLRRLEAECLGLQGQVVGARELAKHLDQDRELLLGALERMRPGRTTAELAQDLLEVCFKPLGLACFYVAVADWEHDLLAFVLYHEGGRARNHPTRSISARIGLSERVLSGRRPVYFKTQEEGRAAGSLLTEAEQATGLIPHTWFGVPLGWGPRPDGLVSFQSFQTDAFNEDRRRLMVALTALMSDCIQPRQLS